MISNVSDLASVKPEIVCMHCGLPLVFSHQEEDVDYDIHENIIGGLVDVYVNPEGLPCMNGCGHFPKDVKVFH